MELTEALLRAMDGEAIAVWTSSGLREPAKQAVKNKNSVAITFFVDRQPFFCMSEPRCITLNTSLVAIDLNSFAF